MTIVTSHYSFGAQQKVSPSNGGHAESTAISATQPVRALVVTDVDLHVAWDGTNATANSYLIPAKVPIAFALAAGQTLSFWNASGGAGNAFIAEFNAA